jgi:hypothetical protein
MPKALKKSKSYNGLNILTCINSRCQSPNRSSGSFWRSDPAVPRRRHVNRNPITHINPFRVPLDRLVPIRRRSKRRPEPLNPSSLAPVIARYAKGYVSLVVVAALFSSSQISGIVLSESFYAVRSMS